MAGLKVIDGIWAQRLQAEYDASDAEDWRLKKFFREQPSASAWSMPTFPNLPFLHEMAQLEKNGNRLAGKRSDT